MELGLRHLQVVVAVADAGGIGRAAAALGIAQPGLTAQLKRIEQDLGSTLFHRGADGAVPTDVGNQFVSGARDVLVRFEQLLATTRSLASATGTEPTIRIGATGGHLLAEVTAVVGELLPAGNQFVQVREDADEIVASLRGRRLDLGLVTEYAELPPPRLDGLSTHDFGAEPLAVALPARHHLAGRAAVELRELAGEAWVFPAEEPDDLRSSVRLACERAGFSPLFRHFGVDTETAATLIRAGQAVGVLPRRAEGTVRIFLSGAPLWRRTRLVWLGRSAIGAAVADRVGAADSR